MIYPTSRAVAVMVAGGLVALAIGLIQPGYWVAGAAWVVLIGGLCLADALLGAPRDRVSLALDAPGALPTAGSAPMSLKISFERRAPAQAEAAAQVNARLNLDAARTSAPVRGGEAEARFELTPARRGEGEIERIWARWVTCRLFVTEKTPGTVFAWTLATSLSACVATAPSSVTWPFFTMM